MKKADITLSSEELHKMIEGDDESLRAYFTSVPHAADITEFIEHTDIHLWPRLLRLIDDPEQRAEVVALIDENQWHDLLSQLQPEEIVGLIRQMESDDAADLIGKLTPQLRIDILRRVPAEDRRDLQQLLRYPEDSAGGIMQIELARVNQNASITDAVARVRQLVEDDVEVLTVWAVDDQDCLVGIVHLADLLLHKSSTLIKSIIETDIVSVTPLVDQEEVAALFKKYGLITLPVVDEQNHLLGRIVVDDVVDVLSEEAEEDALRMGGTSVEEFSHTEEVFTTARIRFPWLSVALLCSFVSASLLHFFDPILRQAVVIVSFLPVINAMGGNVGTQTATILIRGFATGKIDLTDLPRFLFKEIRVGLLMGLIYGLGAGLVATLTFGNGNIYLGLVVWISMTVAMMTAATMGVLAPALLKRWNLDPAISSGPFVTTMNDITGILIYMLTASAFLKHLANT